MLVIVITDLVQLKLIFLLTVKSDFRYQCDEMINFVKNYASNNLTLIIQSIIMENILFNPLPWKSCELSQCERSGGPPNVLVRNQNNTATHTHYHKIVERGVSWSTAMG